MAGGITLIGINKITIFADTCTEYKKTMHKSLSIILLTLFLAGCNSSATIKPFSTDGCSMFPEGTLEHKDLWLNCCLEHDIAYWKGGTYKERKAADLRLRECVAEVGEPAIAELMLKGVRVGGSPYWPTSFRWGYGWPYPRGYTPLSREEQETANDLLSKTVLE